MANYKYELVLDCPNINENEVSYKYYYRITKNEELKIYDFIPQYWTQLKHREHRFKGKECEYQGLSCFATLEEVENMRDKYPKLGQYIYRCEKLEDFATIIDFGNQKYPTHITAYIYENIDEIKDIKWKLEK